MFPDTVEEFMESYKVVDVERVYSNGVEFVPINRMRQWFQHQPERKKGKWIAKEERQKQEIFICSVCKGWAYSPWIGSRKSPKPNRCKYNYCPNCGSYNGEDIRGE